MFLSAVEDVNPLLIETTIESVLIIDVKSGDVLFAKNSDQAVFPASTMKIATVLLTYQRLKNRLREKVLITKEMVAAISPSKKINSDYACSPHLIEVASSHIGLKAGEEFYIEDLFKAAMVASANDACNALALTAFGSYSHFIEELNRFAVSLDCLNTKFVNAHGLHHPQQVTTASDMAKIALECRKYSFIMDIAHASSFKRPKTNLQESVYYAQTNTLLRPSSEDYYPLAYGLKTGYTSIAGANLIALATDEKRDILIAAFNCGKKSREKIKKLFEVVFSEKSSERLLIRGGQDVFKYETSRFSTSLYATSKEDITLNGYPSQEKKVRGIVLWDDLVPPIAKGQYVGVLKVIDEEDRLMKEVNLYSCCNVKESIHFVLERLHYRIRERISSYSLVIIGILILVLFLLPRIRIRR